MSEVQHFIGYGKLRVEYGGLVAEFEKTTEIEFHAEEEYEIYKNVRGGPESGKRFMCSGGYYMKIARRVYYTEATSKETFKKFIRILNNSRQSNPRWRDPIKVYPEYDPNFEHNQWYWCYMTNGANWHRAFTAEVGQYRDLEFIGSELLLHEPSYTHGDGEGYGEDYGDDYGG